MPFVSHTDILCKLCFLQACYFLLICDSILCVLKADCISQPNKIQIFPVLSLIDPIFFALDVGERGINSSSKLSLRIPEMFGGSKMRRFYFIDLELIRSSNLQDDHGASRLLFTTF